MLSSNTMIGLSGRVRELENFNECEDYSDYVYANHEVIAHLIVRVAELLGQIERNGDHGLGTRDPNDLLIGRFTQVELTWNLLHALISDVLYPAVNKKVGQKKLEEACELIDRVIAIFRV